MLSMNIAQKVARQATWLRVGMRGHTTVSPSRISKRFQVVLNDGKRIEVMVTTDIKIVEASRHPQFQVGAEVNPSSVRKLPDKHPITIVHAPDIFLL